MVLAAENEARALGNNFVSTEHLLLGLLDEADGEGLGGAVTALEGGLGVDLGGRCAGARSGPPQRSGAAGRGAARVPAGQHRVPARGRKRGGRADHVGTEHLLLGRAERGG